MDGAGNMYIVGSTESTFAGVTPRRAHAGGRDAFVGKIPPAGGAFSYFTYLGGSFTDAGHGIAADAAGNAYMTGVTGSQNFPIVNPIQATQELFRQRVTKLNVLGFISYSTYLGGHHTDAGFDIAVDAAGSAHVVGITQSTNFPTANARQPFLRGFNDVFVSKLSPSGSSLVYSTYLGGNAREQGQGILDFSPQLNVALDAAGNTYVTGPTQSNDCPAVFALRTFGGGTCLDFPIISNAAMLRCLRVEARRQRPAGVSTPIGGSSDNHGRGIAVAHDGSVYIAGTTFSSDFPVRAPLRPTLSGTSDAFIAKISTAPPACQLPAPVLRSPTGGVLDNRPTFTWDAVAGADGYVALGFNLGPIMLTWNPAAAVCAHHGHDVVHAGRPAGRGRLRLAGRGVEHHVRPGPVERRGDVHAAGNMPRPGRDSGVSGRRRGREQPHAIRVDRGRAWRRGALRGRRSVPERRTRRAGVRRRPTPSRCRRRCRRVNIDGSS